MDNKDVNNQSPNNDSLNWRSLGFFSAEDYLIYVFKKTEKITSALYLVSGLLKDDEPLKWELRDRGMDLLSSSFTASSSAPVERSAIIHSLFTAALETISLLNVARVSNLISEMNHILLVKEIDNVVSMLKNRLAQNAENAGYVLSEQFFNMPSLFNSEFKSDKEPKYHKYYKNINKFNKSSNSLDKGQNMALTDKKSQRQESIINLLKGQSGLTIKDFVKVITDCSEKTIQRELLELVEKGIVRKDGERRWSKYSIV